MHKDILKYLAEAGQQAPSADNSQSWKFTVSDQNLHLFIDLEKLKGSCFDVAHPAILLAMGAVIENIMQAADWINIDINYSSELDLVTGNCATFHVSEKYQDLPDNAKNHPLFSRKTNRLPFDPKKIPQNLLTEIISPSDSIVKIKVFEEKEELKQWMEWICTASEVRFQTPDIHEWFGKSLKFTPAETSSNEGLDVNTLGLPLVGKLILKVTQTWKRMSILNKLGTYKLIAKLESLNVLNTSALIGFFAPLSNENSIEIGRLMERTWISLNESGLNVQPYFVITDQLYRLQNNKISPDLTSSIEKLENNINSKFKPDFLYMLFRVGYCEKQPTNSLRRPVYFK